MTFLKKMTQFVVAVMIQAHDIDSLLLFMMINFCVNVSSNRTVEFK